MQLCESEFIAALWPFTGFQSFLASRLACQLNIQQDITGLSGPVRSGLQRASAQLEEEEEENSASLWRDDTAVKRKKKNTGSERWCEKTAGEVSVCLPVCSHSQCVRQQQALGVVGGLGTRLAVSVGHDEA